jgi:ribosomal protein L11 methyltransferase
VAEGWEDRWREFHHGVEIGPLWVGPPWESPPAWALAVVIDPGRAFGTGAHPSTRLCLELLLDQQPGSLLDIGCGSGVVAIAAARLGFDPVLAVDIDDVAVEVTRANAKANAVTIDAEALDARELTLVEADLAVANISLEAVHSLPGLAASSVIAAGYLAADTPELPGYVQVDRRELDGWAGDLLVRE